VATNQAEKRERRDEQARRDDVAALAASSVAVFDVSVGVTFSLWNLPESRPIVTAGDDWTIARWFFRSIRYVSSLELDLQLPLLDTFRTLVVAPSPEVMQLFVQIHDFAVAR
jgi:hypothetical protein